MNFIIYLNAKHFFGNENYIIIQKSLRNMPSILEMHKLFNSRDVKILLKLVKVGCPTVWSTQRQIRPFLDMY